jgi:type IV pilus assembly protein PilV
MRLASAPRPRIEGIETMNMKRPARRAQQFGSTLLEVMIAVLVLSTGMLGVAAMQATTLRNSQSALARSQAVMQSYAIVDAMRANKDVARNNGYNLALPSTCAVPSAGTTLATRDLNAWITSLQATMGPAACGGVACLNRVCLITIRWDDGLGSGGSNVQQLQMRGRI